MKTLISLQTTGRIASFILNFLIYFMSVPCRSSILTMHCACIMHGAYNNDWFSTDPVNPNVSTLMRRDDIRYRSSIYLSSDSPTITFFFNLSMFSNGNLQWLTDLGRFLPFTIFILLMWFWLNNITIWSELIHYLSCLYLLFAYFISK